MSETMTQARRRRNFSVVPVFAACSNGGSTLI